MKKFINLLIGLLLISYCSIKANQNVNESSLSPSDSIRVISSPELYNLSVRWADEYTKLNPETKIRITKVSDPGVAYNLLEKGDLGFVSGEYFSGFEEKPSWKIVVGRDVIVPVINSKNPYLGEISGKGVSPENLAFFLSNDSRGNWGSLLKGNQNAQADFYYINDKAISDGIRSFLKKDKSDLTGNSVANPSEFLAAIKKNPLALGFCRMTDILDPRNNSISEDIRLLPIDRNGNGVIDYNEKIYDDLNGFSRGIWIGKYPKALISNIYSVSPGQPKNKDGKAFLKWILNDGQQYLYSNGYSDLLLSERQSTTDKLSEARVDLTSTTQDKSIFSPVLIILAIIFLAGFITDFAVRTIKRKKPVEKTIYNELQPALHENSVIIPGGLYFDKTHTWAFMEQTGNVKIGIDDFLQHITGTITRLKMKNEGDKVKKGEIVLSLIQNGKQLNIYSPVSGKIREVNSLLRSNAAVINASPYNEGWVYRIEPDNWLRENQLLFMAEKQKLFLKNEFARLKDFLSLALKDDSEKFACVILQDGGEVADSTLSNLGPEVWEEFQTKFIDPSRQVWFYELF